MKIETARFITSAASFDDCPESKLREFAFVGRSNVGKSSLINMLTGKRELAKTSGVPGKTRLISFFEINENWRLVDLPGYGYAKISKAQRTDFNIEVSAYLTQRDNLELVFALIDSQLEPLDGDLAFLDWMEQCGVPYAVILTKTDKGAEKTVKHHMGLFRERLTALQLKPAQLFTCSAKTNRGRGPILEYIQGRLPKVPRKKSKAKLNLSWMERKR